MLEKKNYKHNMTVPLEDNTVINGQGCGKVAEMKYGFFNMSYNGCEMIALHNSQVLRGEKSSLKVTAIEPSKPKCPISGTFVIFSPRNTRVLFRRIKSQMHQNSGICGL